MKNDFWRLRIACAVLFGVPLIVAATLRLFSLVENFWNAFYYSSLGVRRLNYEEIENNNNNYNINSNNILHNSAPLDQLNINILDLEERMSLESSIIVPSTPFT